MAVHLSAANQDLTAGCGCIQRSGRTLQDRTAAAHKRTPNLKISSISRIRFPSALASNRRFPHQSESPTGLQINSETSGDAFGQSRYLRGLHVEFPNDQTRLTSSNNRKLTQSSINQLISKLEVVLKNYLNLDNRTEQPDA